MMETKHLFVNLFFKVIFLRLRQQLRKEIPWVIHLFFKGTLAHWFLVWIAAWQTLIRRMCGIMEMLHIAIHKTFYRVSCPGCQNDRCCLMQTSILQLTSVHRASVAVNKARCPIIRLLCGALTLASLPVNELRLETVSGDMLFCWLSCINLHSELLSASISKQHYWISTCLFCPFKLMERNNRLMLVKELDANFHGIRLNCAVALAMLARSGSC